MVLRVGQKADNIDIDYCSKEGIIVSNCLSMDQHEIAELTFALMLGIDRRITDQNQLLKEGLWHRDEFKICRGLKDRTLGLIGFDQVAQQVAKRA